MANILIVEDDKRISDIIRNYLIEDKHNCIVVMDGVNAVSSYTKDQPDLVILDVMLPNLDGYQLCQIIRAMSDVPIIMLTVKGAEIDKLKGYQLGADDYMTKPFSPKVLVAKVRALLKRRETKGILDVVNYGIINMHLSKREVFVYGEKISLTYKEFELLKVFVQNPGIVFSRERLLDNVWGYEFAGGTRTVDTHIKTLRYKLGDAGDYIITMIRSGYKFEVLS